MAYNQQFDFGTGAASSAPQSRGYAEHRQYRNERHDYFEKPTNVQQYDNHEYDMQQPRNYNYHEEDGHGGGRGYDRDEYRQPPMNGYNGHRSPPIQSPPLRYDERGYNGEANRPPMKQPRHEQASRAARNGPPASQPSRQYPQDRSREPNYTQQQHGSTPHRNAAPRQAQDVYQTNGNGQRDEYSDPRYRSPDHQSYPPNQDGHQQSHHPGQSNGYEEQGYNGRTGARRGGREFTSQRPQHEHPRSRSTGRHKVDKRQIFGDGRPPDTVAWDNPFPTFPAGGKKKGLHDEKSLNGSIEDMHIRDSGQNASSSRPQTSDSSDRPGREGLQLRSQQSNGHTGYGAQPPASFQDTFAEARGGPYADSSLPRPSTGRRSVDNARNMPRTNGAFYPDTDRSKTMPEKISSAVSRTDFQGQQDGQAEWSESGPTGGYYGREDPTYAPERPSTTSGSRPSGPAQSRSNGSSRLREDRVRSPQGNGIPSQPPRREPPPASRHDTVADVYDSYYQDSNPGSPGHRDYRAYRPPAHEEMPNFDVEAVASPGHHRGTSIDDHLQAQQSFPDMKPMPNQYPNQHPAAFDRSQAHGQVPRSRSQPDLKNRRPPRPPPDDGFDFGLPADNSALPPDPHRQNGNRSPRQYPSNHPPPGPNHDLQYGAPREHPRQPPAPFRTIGGPRPADTFSEQSPMQAPPDLYRPPTLDRPSPNGQMRGPGNRPSPDFRAGPSSPPAIAPVKPPMKPPVKPDALPAHPAPVRPGLMSSPSPNQAPKPVPVRNYNSNSSPLQNYGPTQPPSAAQPIEAPRAPAPVTLTELDTLRQDTKANPSDQRMQMTLAKKLAQAAAELDVGVPRMDQKTIQKTRERYCTEAYKLAKRLVSTGNADAMFFLGDSYSQGRLGLERDSKEAFTLYQSAAKAGHAQAAFRVAVCCELGLEEDGGTKRDLGKAVQWYQRAAQLGDTPAMYKTGVIKLKGLLGQPKDTGEAVVWLRRAAEKADKDNPHALHELVSRYLSTEEHWP